VVVVVVVVLVVMVLLVVVFLSNIGECFVGVVSGGVSVASSPA